MKRIAVTFVAFLAVAGVVGFLVTRPGGLGETAGPPSSPERVQRAATDEGRLNAFSPVAGERAPAAPVPAPGESLGEVIPIVGPEVVKTADLSVVVSKGRFDEAFRKATLVAGTYGGFVASSSTSGRKVPSGTLVIRVPAASFERALNDLRALGEVESESISGEDVSAQFVDLEARLRTWEAQEEVLLRLMDQATSVADTLRVQRELQDVQLRIEQIRGQLRVLRDRTELATIAVTVHEPGAVIREAERRPSLARAWRRAVDGFLAVVYAVVVGLGYLVPVTVLAGLVAVGIRRLRARPAPREA